MRKLLIVLSTVLLLSGCQYLTAANKAANSPLSAQAVADARTTVLGVEQVYGVAVISADHWAQQPRCGSAGAQVPPLCSTAGGVIAVNKAAVATKASLLQAEGLVLKTTPDQSELDFAVSLAKSAWASYQSVLTTYGIKTTN